MREMAGTFNFGAVSDDGKGGFVRGAGPPGENRHRGIACSLRYRYLSSFSPLHMHEANDAAPVF